MPLMLSADDAAISPRCCRFFRQLLLFALMLLTLIFFVIRHAAITLTLVT